MPLGWRNYLLKKKVFLAEMINFCKKVRATKPINDWIRLELKYHNFETLTVSIIEDILNGHNSILCEVDLFIVSTNDDYRRFSLNFFFNSSAERKEILTEIYLPDIYGCKLFLDLTFSLLMFGDKADQRLVAEFISSIRLFS